ncbi:MAG: cation:proton antiporter, partial [Terriglobales bacterium]
MAIGFVGLLVFLAHLLVGVFNRTGIPDVLWLLFIGLALGPGFHLVTPRQFGAVGPVFNTVTLILIIFESSLELRLHNLKVALPGTASLTLSSFVGVIVLVGGLGLALHLGWWQAAILGVILGGNSPTVVAPLVKGLPLEVASGNILFLESVVGDVISIALCLALIQAGLMHASAGAMATGIAASFAVAAIAGGICGVIWS